MEIYPQPVDHKSVRVYVKNKIIWFEHRCRGRHIKYSLPFAIWQVVSHNPLTISPYINCGFCGLSGKYVQDSWHPIEDGPIAGRG